MEVENYWTRVVTSSVLPPYVVGDSEYGVTNLNALNAAGARGEFLNRNERYTNRQTFALRIGYVGTRYNGFQKQNNVAGVHTVEDDIKIALGCYTCAAGRTDADVSAVSQVVSFIKTKENVSSEALLERMRASEPCIEGRLNVYDCARVPRKFNARASATWRRYLYVIPLNTGPQPGGHDVDIEYAGKVLAK
jgi:tRNA U38,U39,U40 pseudouridine synthase TruA